MKLLNGIVLVFFIGARAQGYWRAEYNKVTDLILERGKPLQLAKSYPQIQIEGLRGTLYTESFSQLYQVMDLRIGSNQITTIESGAICSAPNLRSFEITFNENQPSISLKKRMFEGCGNLEKLAILAIDINPVDIDEDTFQNILNLKVLILRSVVINRLTRGYLSNLRSLTSLTLQNCYISSIDSQAFSALNKLEELRIFHNNLPSLPRNLFQTTPNLKDIFLVHNNISEITWDEFNGLSSLLKLNVDSNRIHNFDADKIFEYMPKLRQFNLQYNPIGCTKREVFVKKLKAKLHHSVYIKYKPDAPFDDSCEYYEQ